jgi:hypothetical protein
MAMIWAIVSVLLTAVNVVLTIVNAQILDESSRLASKAVSMEKTPLSTTRQRPDRKETELCP